MLKLSTILRTILSSVTLSLLLAVGSGCKDSSQSQGVGWQPNVPFGTLPPGFDSFPERWNKQINDRLAREEAAKQKEIRELRDKFFKEEDPKIREKLQSKLIADEAALSVIHRRQTEGDYIKFKTPADIPQNLKWEDGLDNPEIGDPNAKKGGVLRQWAPGSYPDTFRPNGPNSNSGFRGPLYDEIIIGLVSIHPVTGKIIPGIAHKWAESADRRTVYFELDPDARYSDGAKVKAIDLLVNMYIRTSEYSRDVFYNNFFYQNASNITIYDDNRFSITLPFAKPLLPFYCTLFIPSPPHFYCEFGPSYVERYQWRVPPTTGAYVVKPDGIIRGRQVTLQRVPDWWAREVNIVTTSKIRNLLAMTADIYNQVLTYTSEKLDDEICGRIEYLRIRFIYECGREPKVKAFVKQAEILEILKEIRQSKKNYLLFSKYMEALIAFHKYYGGKEQ